MYPNVKHCMMSDMHLLEVGHVGSFLSVQCLRQPSIQSILKHKSEMEWGHPVGKQLQSHFDFHCFVFVGKQTILMLR